MSKRNKKNRNQDTTSKIVLVTVTLELIKTLIEIIKDLIE